MRGERYYCLYLYKVSAIIVSVHCTIRKNIILYDLFLYSRVVHSLLLATQIVTSVFCDLAVCHLGCVVHSATIDSP